MQRLPNLIITSQASVSQFHPRVTRIEILVHKRAGRKESGRVHLHFNERLKCEQKAPVAHKVFKENRLFFRAANNHTLSVTIWFDVFPVFSYIGLII